MWWEQPESGLTCDVLTRDAGTRLASQVSGVKKISEADFGAVGEGRGARGEGRGRWARAEGHAASGEQGAARADRTRVSVRPRARADIEGALLPDSARALIRSGEKTPSGLKGSGGPQVINSNPSQVTTQRPKHRKPW